MKDLHTIHGRVSKGHDLTIYFNDKSKSIMPEIRNEDDGIHNKNAIIELTMDTIVIIIESLVLISLIVSVIGALMTYSCHKDKTFTFFEVLFIIAGICYMMIVFNIDDKICEFFKGRFCKAEYDLENYLDIQGAIETCSGSQTNQIIPAVRKYSSLVWYRVSSRQVMINIGQGIIINDNLKDDTVIVNGYMDLNDRCYKMDIQMNEYTKNCLENVKEE